MKPTITPSLRVEQVIRLEPPSDQAEHRRVRDEPFDCHRFG